MTIRKVLPQRWNEVVGLQHCKVYIFDDSEIISGANLSSDYFTDRWLNLIMFLFLLQSPHICGRQDRYVVVENCPGLADYYESYIDCIGELGLASGVSPDFDIFREIFISPGQWST